MPEFVTSELLAWVQGRQLPGKIQWGLGPGLSVKKTPRRRRFLLPMNTLIQSMTDKTIVKMLVAMRTKLSARRHDAHFFNSITATAPHPSSITHELDKLLPPRHKWMRPGRKQRASLPLEDLQRNSLMNATMRGLACREGIANWAQELRKLIIKTHERVLNPHFLPLTPPIVRPLPKPPKEGDGGITTYRVVASYEDLSDRLLLGGTAKYLTPLVDPLLKDCSCAFRANRDISRDTAVARIATYLKTHSDQQVYATECDIKGFFDSVNHDVARQALSSAASKLAIQKIEIDPHVLAIVDQYLDGYDYFEYALPRAVALMETHRTGELSGPNREDLLKLASNNRSCRFGIPQGGPLSPILANLILDSADRAVLEDEEDSDLLYLRYCDDMIILHTDKEKCAKALKRYITAVTSLGFLVHEPKRIARYGADFYDEKSKLPYRVDQPSRLKNASSWVNFLGYQIRYDGQIRVRKDSLDRHKKKQADFAMKIKRMIARPRAILIRPNGEILNSIVGRLVAAGVGRKMRRSELVDNSRCWLSAFPLLTGNRYAISQMRKLDQHRDRLISNVIRALKAFHPGNTSTPNHLPPHDQPQGQLKRPFVGKPMSYCGRLLGDKPCRSIWPRVTYDRYGREF